MRRLLLSSAALVTCLGEAVPLDVAMAVAVVADYRVLWVAVIPVAMTFTCGVANIGALLAGDVGAVVVVTTGFHICRDASCCLRPSMAFAVVGPSPGGTGSIRWPQWRG